MPPKPMPIRERLMRHAVRQGECLIYTGSPNVERPKMSIPGTKPRQFELVYRVAYALEFGPIPNGYDVHHNCENVRCIEPTHLQAKTRLAHSVEHLVEETHCVHGHEWTPENTYVRGYTKAGRPIRTCKRCRSIHQSARDRAKRAAKRKEEG